MKKGFFTLFFFITIFISGCNLPIAPEYLIHASANDRTTTLLKAPKIGDVYIVRVDHFSAYVYGDDDAAYGLLKVNQVTPTQLAARSSNTANTSSMTVQQWLTQTPEGFTWDEDEEIIIQRQELRALFESGMLIEAIRPETQ